MKKTQEGLLQFMRAYMLEEHVHFVTWPLKIEENLLSQILDDSARSKAIHSIKNELAKDLESRKYEDLINLMALLTWKSQVLEQISVAMAKKIEMDMKSAHKLLKRERIYEDIKTSNRLRGSSTANKRHETDLKKIAKKKWFEYRKSSGKRCGIKTFLEILSDVPGSEDLKYDTAKGWIRQWNSEFKKG